MVLQKGGEGRVRGLGLFRETMSYFMSPQTQRGLLPSGPGERGAPGTGGGTTTFHVKLLPGSGEVEVVLGSFGLAQESIVLEEKAFQVLANY